ncbi:uncharacterized protein LOC135814915 [Sycon ciliatum]|uniref:uncharacterized protein LOC135814915 n=1 Tax=Sycon ciliatum TaxID=27933 RepID=UPI0031F6CFF0
MSIYWSKAQAYYRKNYRTLRLFGPLTVFMVGGTYFLTECYSVQFDRRRQQDRLDKTEEMVSEIRRENKAKKTIAINSEDDLEKTRQEMVGQFKLETYDIVRGPREWEEGTTERVQELYDQRMKEIEEAHRAEEEGAAAAQGS